MLLESMQWSGQHEWSTQPRGLWVSGDAVSGYSKALRGPEFVVVYNSGHMVPLYHPAPALDLITRFLTNATMVDVELPSFDFGFKGDRERAQRLNAILCFSLTMGTCLFYFILFGEACMDSLKACCGRRATIPSGQFVTSDD